MVTLAAYKKQILPKIKDRENPDENAIVNEPVIQMRTIGDVSNNERTAILQTKKENAMLMLKKIQRFNIEDEFDERYERAKETIDTNISTLSHKIDEHIEKLDLEELKDSLRIEERYTKAKELIGNRIRKEKKRWNDTSSTSSENEEDKQGSSSQVRRRKKTRPAVKDKDDKENVDHKYDSQPATSKYHLEDDSFNIIELEEAITKPCIKRATIKPESKVDRLLRFRHEQKSNLMELKDSLQIENKYMKVKEGIGKSIDDKKRKVGLKSDSKSNEQSVSYKCVSFEQHQSGEETTSIH